MMPIILQILDHFAWPSYEAGHRMIDVMYIGNTGDSAAQDSDMQILIAESVMWTMARLSSAESTRLPVQTMCQRVYQRVA